MSWLDTLEEIRTRDFGKASAKEREKVAREVVNLCSYACAVVAVAPMPFSDMVLMLPIQSAMVMTVGHVYGRSLTKAASKDLILELGATVGVGMLARQGLKALSPVVVARAAARGLRRGEGRGEALLLEEGVRPVPQGVRARRGRPAA